MKKQIRRGFIAALASGAFVSLGSSVLGGVTGDVSGIVKDQTGAPVAGAKVEALAPSMTRTATTDAGGHFVILSLAPDTYTIYLGRAGYESISLPGVTVFADQTQALSYTMLKALRTIAHVTSGNNSLVKPEIGLDVYSVNASQVAAAAALRGPGDLNNAYSAMASVPGVQVSQGGIGGSLPWTAAYPPGYVICGYSPAGGSLNSTLYPSNFYNGTATNDYKANGARTVRQQSYLPSTFNNGAIGEWLLRSISTSTRK